MKSATSASPFSDLAKKPFLADIIRKATERVGRKQIWRIAARLEPLPCPASTDAVRDALRDLSIFLPDEDYAAMEAAYASAPSSSSSPSSLINTAALLQDLCTLPLSPRRRYVLDLVIRKLDPNSTGVISYATLSDQYDVLRHPDVCNGARSEDDVTMDFFDYFEQEDGSCMTQLSVTEMRLYAVGLASTMKDDTEFELWCTRAFCLDRPKLQQGVETGRVLGSREHSRQSRFLGEGRQHPLYATTYMEYGKEATPADYKLPHNGRPQQFTRNAVARTGGTTTMNM